MSSLKRGSPPGSLTRTEQKGLPLWYAKTKEPGTGWVAKYQPRQLWRALGSRWWAWVLSLHTRKWWPGYRALWRIRGGIYKGFEGSTKVWT